MKFLSKLTVLALLATTTVAAAEAPPPPAPDAKRVEVSKADGDKFMVFFNAFVNVVVANKDSCPAMATSLNSLIDKNQPIIKMANDSKAAGKKLPKALEEKMMARVKEMMPAMQKCGGDKDVQAAMSRMDKPSTAPAKPAPKK